MKISITCTFTFRLPALPGYPAWHQGPLQTVFSSGRQPCAREGSAVGGTQHAVLWTGEWTQSASRGRCCLRPLSCLIISPDLANILLHKIELVNCTVNKLLKRFSSDVPQQAYWCTARIFKTCKNDDRKHKDGCPRGMNQDYTFLGGQISKYVCARVCTLCIILVIGLHAPWDEKVEKSLLHICTDFENCFIITIQRKV